MNVLEYGSPAADIVLLHPVDDHDLEGIQHEIAAIRAQLRKDFRLLAFKVEDWNRDLSPWEAPAVFGDEAFGDGAQGTLDEILSYCTDKEKTYYIGGYSLAGLFALWAACRTDQFAGVAAASPSVWFPGFDTFLKEQTVRCGRVYLSLGDREERTRNPVMAKVGDRIREAAALFKARGTDCVLEWNKGNHFMDADIRTAKAFIWVADEHSAAVHRRNGGVS